MGVGFIELDADGHGGDSNGVGICGKVQLMAVIDMSSEWNSESYPWAGGWKLSLCALWLPQDNNG